MEDGGWRMEDGRLMIKDERVLLCQFLQDFLMQSVKSVKSVVKH